jgi:hypothetical protein
MFQRLNTSTNQQINKSTNQQINKPTDYRSQITDHQLTASYAINANYVSNAQHLNKSTNQPPFRQDLQDFGQS